jgi:hypothetical protein
MLPVTRVVDENHPDDRKASKEVEGREAPAGGGRGRREREILLACDGSMLERRKAK